MGALSQWGPIAAVGAVSLAALVVGAIALSRVGTAPGGAISAQQGTFSTIYVSNGTFQYISAPQITALSAQVNETCTWSQRVLAAGTCTLLLGIDSRCGNYSRVTYPYTINALSCGETSSPAFIKLSVDISAATRSVYFGSVNYSFCFSPGVCVNQTCTLNGFGLGNFTNPLPISTPGPSSPLFIPGGVKATFSVASVKTWNLQGTGFQANEGGVVWVPLGNALLAEPLFPGYAFYIQGTSFELILATLA